MADAAKYLPVNGGTFISDIGSLLSVLKTRRTMAFVYGIMFAFVAFTAFLAFNPSPNSSSPWFNNIFSIGTTRSSTSTDPYRSQFTSVFSYLFPNNSSSQQEVRDFASPPNQTDSIGSISSISQSPSSNEAHPVAKNTTSESPVITKAQTTSQDHTQSTGNTDAPAALHANQSRVAPTVNEHPSTTNNRTQSDQNFTPQPLKPNLTTSGAPKAPVVAKPTTTAVPKAPVAANRTTIPVSKAPVASNQSTLSVSLEKERPQKGEKGVADDGLSSNYTASPSKGQSNGTIQKDGADSEVSAEQEIENWKQSLMKCDLFDGEWVRDDSYPLYKGGSCTLIDEQFNCVLNGRPDLEYHKLKWKPKGCSLPRFNGAHMLELLRGKRLAFVGDSLNRNMWESLVCILKGSVKDQSKVFEAHGRQIFRGEASYSFIFKDYNCTVEFFVSPFLVQEWEYADKNGIKKETLRLDLVGRSSDQYKGADIIIFNTGHWWTHDKTSKGKDYYQEGSHVYSELNVLEAFRKALTTWGRWVDANINPAKSLVFFRGYSASHFSGGQWNSGGACDSETEPIKNETYLSAYPPKMQVLESVLKGMKTHVTYLNITRLTDYRKDGHPSIYRKQKLSDEERKSPLRYQDCSHWCLPGVPDAWNELFYAELLVKENKMRQRQRRP